MSIPASALENLTDLRTPEDQIKWRQGPGGKQLAYVDARYVMSVLDQLVGPENWQRAHQMSDGGKVSCSVSILVEFPDGHQEWVTKTDGAGETDIEGEKGSFSDSFKRACSVWGVGRDLYAMQPTNAVRSASPQRPAAPQRDITQDDSFDLSDLEDEANCPIHAKPWRTNSRGYYCATKLADGSWCRAQPSKGWQAAHEVG